MNIAASTCANTMINSYYFTFVRYFAGWFFGAKK